MVHTQMKVSRTLQLDPEEAREERNLLRQEKKLIMKLIMKLKIWKYNNKPSLLTLLKHESKKDYCDGKINTLK